VIQNYHHQGYLSKLDRGGQTIKLAEFFLDLLVLSTVQAKSSRHDKNPPFFQKNLFFLAALYFWGYYIN